MSQVHAATQPDTLGQYDLSERLGIGAQGEVWRAYDRRRGVEVAVKILAADRAASAAAWATLEREYAFARQLQHPGILQVLPPERIEGHLVLPMELADGADLAALRGGGYLHIVPVLLEIAVALQYAHERGVVHRDLKPANILFDRRGRVKLADFGVAAALSPQRAQRAGTFAREVSPFSASPEQLRGEPARPADDIYGLGTLAYDLLAGRPPYFPYFDAVRIQTGPVPRLKPLQPAPSRLIDLILWMLAPRAEDRPADMQQVIEELEACLNATSAIGPVPDCAYPPRQRVPREPPVEAEPEPALAPEPEPALAAEPEPALAAEPEPALAAEPEPALAAEPDLLAVDDDLSLSLEEFPQRHRLRAPRYVYPPRPPRLRYLLVGLVSGAVLVAGALQWLSRQGQRDGPLEGLSRTVFGAAIGRLSVDAVRRAGLGPAVRRAAVADSPAPVPRVARWAEFNSRLIGLAARGAPIWDAADFAAARAQAADSRRAEQVGDIVAAREHWQRAQHLLARLEREAPRAQTAGHGALAGGPRAAADAALVRARRIGPASRRAAGAQPAHLAAALRPLMSAARRAERVHDYVRAASDAREVLAREPGYAPARATLADVDTAFARSGYARAEQAGVAAFAAGRLFQAQADFQQALVFRPAGLEATQGLEQVNAALRERAASP